MFASAATMSAESSSTMIAPEPDMLPAGNDIHRIELYQKTFQTRSTQK